MGSSQDDGTHESPWGRWNASLILPKELGSGEGYSMFGVAKNPIDRTNPPTLNHTLLALIPKTKEPKSPKEFRPISLCKVLYKILAKVLANRLKRILDLVITENQYAFVPGRNITDNIMVGFECFHAMKNRKQGKKGYVAAKLDIAKAYDRVEWRFLESIMLKMGFHEDWVHLIMQCVTTVTYSALVIGH
ncbi:unnamed protein product [Linum trigynum]|uniref:Reverse transcriptase domain-containing protein n=1 Tax=Linum trigynum TaxID=586398 RepID=A0AAV2ELJ0_9ROSI